MHKTPRRLNLNSLTLLQLDRRGIAAAEWFTLTEQKDSDCIGSNTCPPGSPTRPR